MKTKIYNSLAIMHSNNKFRGFTIIELMISITVLGVIAAIAAPNISDFLRRQNVKAQASNISATMSLARTTALTEAADIQVCWNNTGANVTESGVVIEPSRMVALGSANDVIQEIQYQTDGYYVDDTNANNCITFDSQGRTAADTTFASCTKEGVIEDSLLITVSRMGRASIIKNQVHDCT